MFESDLLTIEEIGEKLNKHPYYVLKLAKEMGIPCRAKLDGEKTRSKKLYSLSDFDEDAHISASEITEMAIALCEKMEREYENGREGRIFRYIINVLRVYRYREELRKQAEIENESK